MNYVYDVFLCLEVSRVITPLYIRNYVPAFCFNYHYGSIFEILSADFGSTLVL